MDREAKGFGRRAFLGSAAAAGFAASTLPSLRAAARYRRHSVTSAQGKAMLASYARGVDAMLQLPPDDPRNWFRNAFVHLMDCPHGNWWFYVWHRGYVGLFEQTIRKLSGDPDFALPFWDWSQLPRIPDELFDGVLRPADPAHERYTKDLATFTAFIEGPLLGYWKSLTKEQLADQAQRGVGSFDELWTQVTGGGVPANQAFAATARARFLSRQNPDLDAATTYDASPGVVLAGLAPELFYASAALGFNSSRTPSHVVQPGGTTWFSILEGMPHNNIHNYIGGVGPWDPGPYGYMTNFLSPADPVFYLHHANMDRLWDVWTRKQQALHLPFRPDDADAAAFMDEPFRFFVDSDGRYLTSAKAGDYFDTGVFDYDYAAGTGEELVTGGGTPVAGGGTPGGRTVAQATVQGNAGAFSLSEEFRSNLVAAVTLQPQAGGARSFDVLVDAPPGVTRAEPGSPFFAGRIAFFGPQEHHAAGGAATFLVPLTHPQPGSAPRRIGPLPQGQLADQPMTIALVPSHGSGPAPAVSAISVQAF